MESEFKESNNHRVSVSDIEYNIRNYNKKICNIQKLVFHERRRAILSLLCIPYFVLLLSSAGVLFLVDFLGGSQFVNEYSSWFAITSLLLLCIVSMILYFTERVWISTNVTYTGDKIFKITRKGTDMNIVPKDLVCGDIIHLGPGENVPADIRIKKCKNLQVGNRVFLNEDTQTKFVSYATDEDMLKSNNMLFQGDTIISGNITGLVINSAKNTILNTLLLQMKEIIFSTNLSHKFSLSNEYIGFLSQFVYSGLLVIIACNAYLVLLGYKKLQLIKISIELLVILVSGTTFIIMTIVLFIWKSKLRNCVMSRAEVSANLGKLDIILIRDISIFYQDNYRISKFWIDNSVKNCEENTFSFEVDQIQYSPTWTALTRAAVLCNSAKFHSGDNEIDQSILLLFNECESVKKWGGSMSKYKENNISILGPVYDSKSNCKLSIHKLNDGDPRLLLILRGSLIDILNSCSNILISGKEQKFGDTWKEEIINLYKERNEKTHIIRAYCDYRISPDIFTADFQQVSKELYDAIPRQNLRFLGIISFVHTMKSSVNSFLDRFTELGIKVVFCESSGDMQQSTGDKRIDDFQLSSMINTKSVLLNNCAISKVDDNVTLQLIKSFQKKGRKVAVLGNNFDDIKAMLQANIGIITSKATGRMVKEVADLCITDSDCFKIDVLIRRSRWLLKALNDILTFTQYPKITLIFFYLGFVLCGLPLSVNLTMILALELCLILPTVCICFQNVEKSKSKIPKLDYKKIKIDLGLIWQIGLIQMTAAAFSYFTTMALQGFWPRHILMVRNRWYSPSVNDLSDSYGQEWTYAQRRELDCTATSVVFFVVLLLQINAAITATSNYSVFTKRLPNLRLIVSSVLSIIFALLFMYLGSQFKFMDLNLFECSMCLTIIPFFIYLIGFTEIRKYLQRHYNKSLWLNE